MNDGVFDTNMVTKLHAKLVSLRGTARPGRGGEMDGVIECLLKVKREELSTERR